MSDGQAAVTHSFLTSREAGAGTPGARAGLDAYEKAAAKDCCGICGVERRKDAALSLPSGESGGDGSNTLLCNGCLPVSGISSSVEMV
jgi:hypothetical protein